MKWLPSIWKQWDRRRHKVLDFIIRAANIVFLSTLLAAFYAVTLGCVCYCSFYAEKGSDAP